MARILSWFTATIVSSNEEIILTLSCISVIIGALIKIPLKGVFPNTGISRFIHNRSCWETRAAERPLDLVVCNSEIAPGSQVDLDRNWTLETHV